jgi:bifunctional non-homologous end joining protein LigD
VPDWIHEIKHDGYRLTVHREGNRVRLFTCNGHDWTDRYPLIVEATQRTASARLSWTGKPCCWGRRSTARSDFTS